EWSAAGNTKEIYSLGGLVDWGVHTSSSSQTVLRAIRDERLWNRLVQIEKITNEFCKRVDKDHKPLFWGGFAEVADADANKFSNPYTLFYAALLQPGSIEEFADKLVKETMKESTTASLLECVDILDTLVAFTRKLQINKAVVVCHFLHALVVSLLTCQNPFHRKVCWPTIRAVLDTVTTVSASSAYHESGGDAYPFFREALGPTHGVTWVGPKMLSTPSQVEAWRNAREASMSVHGIFPSNNDSTKNIVSMSDSVRWQKSSDCKDPSVAMAHIREIPLHSHLIPLDNILKRFFLVCGREEKHWFWGMFAESINRHKEIKDEEKIDPERKDPWFPRMMDTIVKSPSLKKMEQLTEPKDLSEEIVQSLLEFVVTLDDMVAGTHSYQMMGHTMPDDKDVEILFQASCQLWLDSIVT
ncbi:MAG: hypothetical protein Q9220_006418, partial [cf. Caloplaca sp. 1 TL-2023]